MFHKLCMQTASYDQVLKHFIKVMFYYLISAWFSEFQNENRI